MITIEEFMTPGPCTLRASDTLQDARAVMTEKHIRHIPITDDDNHLLGLVTQRDVLAATGPRVNAGSDAPVEADCAKTPLAEVMVREVSVIHPTASLRQAALYLQAHKFGCLPVVADDRLIGIITDSDFIAIAINLLEQAELVEEEIKQEVETENALDEIELPAVEEVV